MFIINDMELLERLGKHGLLKIMLPQCGLAVSAIKLNEYSWRIRKAIEKQTDVKVLQADEHFQMWTALLHEYRKEITVE